VRRYLITWTLLGEDWAPKQTALPVSEPVAWRRWLARKSWGSSDSSWCVRARVSMVIVARVTTRGISVELLRVIGETRFESG